VNPSTAQARVVVDELLRCGITDVVLAPGSRSAPLAIALAQAEERGELALHVRIDERSAGYLALGLGKVSGVPAVVITTSGTAAVNLHPSLVEADLSDVPLLAITADRPAALRGVGANQAIDQPGVFGSCVRMAVDMATADSAVDDGSIAAQQNRLWRSTIARAVAVSTDAMRPGPVHINMPFADPLVPDETGDLPADFDGRSDGRPWTADIRMVAGLGLPLDEILQSLDEDAVVPARGLIIVGDHADSEAIELVDDLGDALGWPVIGEPSGNVADCETALGHGALLLADPDFATEHLPDVVITLGRVGLSRAVARQITRAGLHLAVDARPQWSDPGRSADVVLAQVPLPPEEAEADPSWLASWQRADVLASAAVETALAGEGAIFTGMHVARATAQSLPPGGLLFVGASWPVRHVYSFAATAVREGIVLGNRGTSGIDGCVSTAWGAAIAHQRQDGIGAVALMGDLTFLYDANGLRVPPREAQPDLVIVVADNNGGGIFSQLEQGGPAFAGVFERVFGTPTDADVAAVALAAGMPVVVVEEVDALTAALAEATNVGGIQVIIARTCPREQEARIWATVQRAVGEALGTA
jgi:2-succinyl-5-enolpyruvyl-6-hydroxy-3-cyclohexene-1-carboxylate synthase